jgi:hypothetical protein
MMCGERCIARVSVQIDVTLMATGGDVLACVQIDVTLWGSRLWNCALHTNKQADCRRRTEMLGTSKFTEAMQNWLKQGLASFYLRRALPTHHSHASLCTQLLYQLCYLRRALHGLRTQLSAVCALLMWRCAHNSLRQECTVRCVL